MKKYIYSLLLGLTLTINSCSNYETENSFSGYIDGITIYAPDFIAENGNTRTVIDVDTDGVQFNWSANDTIGIFPDKGRQVDFPMIEGAGSNTATFTGGGWALKASSSYAAYYPLQENFNLDKEQIYLSYIEQCQKGNNSTAHLGIYDYMGTVATTPKNGNVNFQFKHLGALVKLNIPLEEACNLNSIVLESDQEDFITKASLDLTSVPLKVTPIEKSKRYEILLKDMTLSKDNLMANIYFMLSPIDISEKKIVIIVNSELKVYKYEFFGKNFKEGTAYSITVTPSTIESESDDAMILVTRVNFGNNFTTFLPKLSGSDITIDWGDGTKESHSYASETSYTHQYSTNEPMEFDIKITGNLKGLNSYEIEEYSIIGIKQWGTSKFKNISYAFYKQPLQYITNDKSGALQDVTSFWYTFAYCNKLKFIPEDLFENSPNVTIFSCTFEGCSALLTIPKGLFDNCTKITDFTNTFSYCSALTAIPEGLFDNCPNIISFSSTFNNCTALTTIPEGLFDNCTKVTDFTNTFSYCSALTTIPEGLFNKCPDVTFFDVAFSSCISLKAIPINLFDNNRKVKSFENTFSHCINLTGESPYTEIDGIKYHLYERQNNPDQFVTPRGNSCFTDCSGLTDFNNIYFSWK